MSLEERIEQLELINKYLLSQFSELDSRIRTIEISLIKKTDKEQEAETKVRSKLDYLLNQIHKLREKQSKNTS
jgi:hypothetical protein